MTEVWDFYDCGYGIAKDGTTEASITLVKIYIYSVLISFHEDVFKLRLSFSFMEDFNSVIHK